MLLTIVVYIYTVIAFNFFRKFYVSGEEDEVDQKCHDMFTVSYFGIDWRKLSSRRCVSYTYTVADLLNSMSRSASWYLVSH